MLHPPLKVAFLVSILLLAGCGPGGEGPSMEVSNGVLVAPLGWPEASFYAELRNRGSAADSLVRFSVEGASWTMLHGAHGAVGGDTHSMEEVTHIELPPGRRLTLAAGGYHGMVGWEVPPAPGDTIAVTLHFAQSGEITLRVPMHDAGEAR